MLRITKFINDEFYVTDEAFISHDDIGYKGTAINRLAFYENIFDELSSEQLKISKEMEKLRIEGKGKSVKFKELMVKKLTNSNVLSLLTAKNF